MNHYFYIVVEVEGRKRFVSRNMGYSDAFDDAMRFETHELAEDYIEREGLEQMRAAIRTI